MVKVLECECGFVARGEDDGELVVAAQVHARKSHGMELPAHLILARASTAGVRPESGAPQAQGGIDRS
jgi:hypothetical protein